MEPYVTGIPFCTKMTLHEYELYKNNLLKSQEMAFKRYQHAFIEARERFCLLYYGERTPS